jgi:hypothetical protein
MKETYSVIRGVDPRCRPAGRAAAAGARDTGARWTGGGSQRERPPPHAARCGLAFRGGVRPSPEAPDPGDLASARRSAPRSAPGTTHLAADATARVQPAARGDQIADTAAVGGEASAIEAAAREAAGQQRLAVAVGVEANLSRRLRHRCHNGTGKKCSQPHTCGSHDAGPGHKALSPSTVGQSSMAGNPEGTDWFASDGALCPDGNAVQYFAYDREIVKSISRSGDHLILWLLGLLGL